MIRVHLSNHLLNYLDDFCSRQGPTCALGACVNEKDCQSSRLSMTLIADRDDDPEFGRFRLDSRRALPSMHDDPHPASDPSECPGKPAKSLDG